MFKLYKWLAYYIVKPHKKFQHLIKCLAIYLAQQKKITEKKTEKKRERRNSYLSPGRRPNSFWPAQPTRSPLSSTSSAPKASRWRPSTPWTPPRRLRASRPPQDS